MRSLAQNENTTRTSLTWISKEVNLKEELEKHNNHQGSCHILYHAWRHESKMNMHEVLAIIHDGMDTNKTTIPHLQVTTKTNSGIVLATFKPHWHGHSWPWRRCILVITQLTCGLKIWISLYHLWRGAFTIGKTSSKKFRENIWRIPIEWLFWNKWIIGQIHVRIYFLILWHS